MGARFHPLVERVSRIGGDTVETAHGDSAFQ